MIPMKKQKRFIPALVLGVCAFSAWAWAATAPPESGELFDAAKANAAFVSEGAKAQVVDHNGAKALRAEFPAGDGYPAFPFPLPADGWDLSKFAGVQADVTNTGAHPVTVAIRVDNEGDWQKQPWNTESVSLAPGETKTLKVTFGRSYGGNPGFALDPAKVSAVKMFAVQPKQAATVVVKNLKAVGVAAPKVVTGVKGVAPADGVLLNVVDGAEKRLTPSSAQVSVTRNADAAAPGLIVNLEPGADEYPGVSLKPAGAPWDLSAFGHVEAQIVNTGTKTLGIHLRVDNDADWQNNPTNTESLYLQPGKAGTVKTIFGYTYGYKPGYKLNPAAVTNLLIFTGKVSEPQSFRIVSLKAAGPAGETPPVDPNSVRVKPNNGFLLGGDAKIDAATQIAAKGTQATLTDNGALRVVFPDAKGEQSAALKLPQGRWDLREYLQVRVRVKNEGRTPVIPRVRLETNGGPSDWIKTATPLEPGAETELVIPFAGLKTVNFDDKNSGTRVSNDAVSAVTVAAENAEAERALLVTSIEAGMPPLDIPAWLGRRPPVDGEWTQTLNENFDGPKIDDSLWSVSGPNYWDKKTRWSKDNAILGGGVVRLRYEKKRGHHNDDPAQPQKDYTAGFLETYGKWRQRYGYFEARMKLPRAPGLWPAFWMMPDRGPVTAEQWRRQDTKNGGMEFDIMEHLTRWGPNRYNVATHWDGYDKEHKHNGTDRLYFPPDKDGYITAGLLWLPGVAVYYANGKEVARWENERISNVPSDIMFTLPMGGWDNSPLDDTKLPDDFIIDYVRVWQRKDLASDVDGKMAPPPAPAR